MTRTILKDVMASMLVALVLAGAIVLIWFAMLNHARADGYRYPPGPHVRPPPWDIPVGPPPTQSCVETAIQLGYQTGNPRVGLAGVAACRFYAPVRIPQPYYGPAPLGSY